MLHDPIADVWTYPVNDSEEPTPAKTSYPPADEVKAIVTHGHYAVRLRVRFADLRRVGHQAYRVDVQAAKVYFFAAVVAGPGSRAGHHFLERESTVRCRGMRHGIDYGTDVVTMRIPRRCLGRPRWVKVHVDNALWTGGVDHRDVAYEDNPHNDDVGTGSFTQRLYRR